MSFRFGRSSLRELAGVHPRLVDVCTHALAISPVDFSVHDGHRTASEQNALFKAGASTLDGYAKKSKHQEQSDGFAHAVDLVPYINGRMRWEWRPIYKIAEAMKIAGEKYGVQIRWGGHWSELTGRNSEPEDLVAMYVQSRRDLGRSAFIDGPHYEIMNP